MDLEFPNLIIAFFAGLLSFVSPCVLPLVPAYIGYMSGRATRNIALETGMKQKAESGATSVSMRFVMITHGLAFVLGFTVIFVAISIITAVFVGAVGGAVSVFTEIIGRVGGVIIIFFGLHFMGVMRRFFQYLKNNMGILDSILASILISLIFGAIILWGFVDFMIGLPVLAAVLLMFLLGGAFTKPGEFWLKVINTLEQALYMDTRPDMQANARSGLGGSFTMGVIFSAGWTPCIGPLLGTILTVAARTGDVPQAAASLTAYSLGLGIPFLITAGLMEGAQSILRRLQKYMGKIELISGLLLIVIGFAVATGSLQNLSQSLSGQTDLATRIEECGLGLVEGHLSFDQASSCLGGSLTPVAVGQTSITEFNADDSSQSFLFKIDVPIVLDVELAGVKEIFPAEVAIFDLDGNELGRGSEFVQIDESKYALLQGIELSVAGQYTATITFTGTTDEPFTFRFRVKKSEAAPETQSSSNATTVVVGNSNLSSIEALAASEPPIGLELGNRAPDFVANTIDGNQTSLSALRGQIVLVNFWGTWCAPCVREMPDLQSVYERFMNEGFTILALATRGDTREDVLAFRDEFGLTFSLIVDEGEQITDMYAIVSRPSTIIVDENGLIAFKHFGAVVEEQLVELLIEIRST
jgi:cytochrome c-type biogenesis protein